MLYKLFWTQACPEEKKEQISESAVRRDLRFFVLIRED